jgi:hypothetical protein
VSRSRNKIRVAVTSSCIGVQSNGIWHEFPLKTAGQQPDLSGLTQHLNDLHIRGHAVITLSARVAPVWLLPPAPVRLNQSEIKGWVSEQLADQFGDLAESWRLSWDAPAPGEPVLVSAVNLIWFDALLETLRLAGLTADSVQPWLSVAYRSRRNDLSGRVAWLALIEPGQISLAGFVNGGLNVIRNNATDDQTDLVQTLSDMLHRESLLNPKMQASDIWIRPVQVVGDWQRLKNIKVHATPVDSHHLVAMGDL